jgi:hypothetical protein
MRSMEAYPRAAMERAMKVQDVMLQTMAKKITSWKVPSTAGLSLQAGNGYRPRACRAGKVCIDTPP